MITATNLIIGTIIHIGKTFESYDGTLLSNRFMCIIGIENNNILMLPMSTFHDKDHKIKKIRQETNFPYLQKHGNTKNGYIKCDQLYVLSIDYFNKFTKEIQLKYRMNDQYFQKLMKYTEALVKATKIELVRKDLIFENEINLNHNPVSKEANEV